MSDKLAQALRYWLPKVEPLRELGGNNPIVSEHRKQWHGAFAALAEHEAAKAEPALCRTDGRCQYAIDSGAEGMGHCPKGKCVMPVEPAPELTDEELLQAIRQCGAGCVADWGLKFARAVIAAHKQKRGVK